MYLNEFGEIARCYWLQIPEHYSSVYLDEFIIMPDHIHAIIFLGNKNDITEFVGTEHCSVPTIIGTSAERRHYGLLSKIIKSYKNELTKVCNKSNLSQFLWQRSYYDHVIRNEQSLISIRKYIRLNPGNWSIEKNAQVAENIAFLKSATNLKDKSPKVARPFD
jgi:REP element-mobilizing transposase RayT